MSKIVIKGSKLCAESCIFLLCDVQEAFRGHVRHFCSTVEVIKRLLDGAKLLNIPLLVTEQYPKGLKSTVVELDISHAAKKFEKTNFTMLVPEFVAHLQTYSNAKHMVLFGLETHVCIQQTCFDLMERGFEVFVVADACSSRTDVDRHFALQRMKQAGAVLTTYESVLLQLCGSKDHAQFKAMQNIIRALPPDSGLMNNKL